MFKMEFPTGIGETKYVVEQRAESHYSITKIRYGCETFICHKENSRQATKLAKLLAKTYYEAWYDGQY